MYEQGFSLCPRPWIPACAGMTEWVVVPRTPRIPAPVSWYGAGCAGMTVAGDGLTGKAGRRARRAE